MPRSSAHLLASVVLLLGILGSLTRTSAQQPAAAAAPRRSLAGPTVEGNRAVIRSGIAYAPSNAPDHIKRAIWAVNGIVGRPYKWGGGHASFKDSGYDCSGTVSFALYHAGLLGTPLPSSDLIRFGDRGRGRWMTIYARRGHAFLVIAGLRLDTTDFRSGGNTGPRWHLEGRDTGSFESRTIRGA
jgi:hypothetical protein